jgi:hypothetical protein
MVRAGGEITPPTTASAWNRAAKWAFSVGGNRFSDRCQPNGLKPHRDGHSRHEAVAAEAGTLTGVPDPTRLAARFAREKRNPAVGRTAGQVLVWRGCGAVAVADAVGCGPDPALCEKHSQSTVGWLYRGSYGTVYMPALGGDWV